MLIEDGIWRFDSNGSMLNLSSETMCENKPIESISSEDDAFLLF